MESSSSSSYHSCCSFAPSPNERENTHDVFLNYRGDTRCGFTSHLFAGFERRGIKVYVDYNNLKRGDEISFSLLEAIERSKISIIIFSRNYASSKWSLDELVKIMECKRGRGRIVIPVFYEINPSVVRNQTGSYAVAFARHRRCFKASINQKVQRWRNAMTEAANLAGWDSSHYRMECELVEDIVNDVMRKLENQGDEIEEQRESMSMEPQSQNSFQAPNSQDSQDLAAKFQRLNLKFEDFLATLAHWVVKYQPLIVIKSAVRYVRNNLVWNQIGMKEEREAEVAEERIRLFNYNTTHFSSDTSLAEEARRLAEIERLRELYTLKGRVESFAKLRGIDVHEILQYYTV